MKNTPKPPGLEETGKMLKEQADNLEKTAFFRPQKPTVVKETRMPEGLILLGGVVFFVFAIVILLKTRDNDAKKANETYQSVLMEIKDVNTKLDKYVDSQKAVCQTFADDITKLQKKTDAPQTMNLALTHPLAVNVTLIEKHTQHPGPNLPPTPDKQKVPPHHVHKAPSLDQ